MESLEDFTEVFTKWVTIKCSDGILYIPEEILKNSYSSSIVSYISADLFNIENSDDLFEESKDDSIIDLSMISSSDVRLIFTYDVATFLNKKNNKFAINNDIWNCLPIKYNTNRFSQAYASFIESIDEFKLIDLYISAVFIEHQFVKEILKRQILFKIRLSFIKKVKKETPFLTYFKNSKAFTIYKNILDNEFISDELCASDTHNSRFINISGITIYEKRKMLNIKELIPRIISSNAEMVKMHLNKLNKKKRDNPDHIGSLYNDSMLNYIFIEAPLKLILTDINTATYKFRVFNSKYINAH